MNLELDISFQLSTLHNQMAKACERWTKDELLGMLDDAKEHFEIKRRECKSLRKELKALKQAFDELNATHKSLKACLRACLRAFRAILQEQGR